MNNSKPQDNTKLLGRASTLAVAMMALGLCIPCMVIVVGAFLTN